MTTETAVMKIHIEKIHLVTLSAINHQSKFDKNWVEELEFDVKGEKNK